MTGVNNNGISFGKKLGSVNFSNFNGISKNSFGDNVNKELLEAFFKKYDANNDGILDEGELKSLQSDIETYAGKNQQLGKNEANKFIHENLGLEEKSSLSREDLHAFLTEISADKDTIASAVTDANGLTTIRYKADKDGSVKTSQYKNENGKSVIFSDSVSYTDNSTVNTFYTNGEISSRQRVKGSVTEFLDFNNNDRILERQVDKGSGNKEKTVYTYDANSSAHTETTYSADGKPVNILKKDGGQIISSQDITYDEDGNKTTITTAGQSHIKDVRDKDGNLSSRVDVDENGETKAYTHTVEGGDTWYGIVEAKYGLEDKNQIMEIVHQLKAEAGIDKKATTMPDEVTLPATVELSDGTKISLKNIDAGVNWEHNIEGIPPITPPPALTEAEIPKPLSAEAIKPLAEIPPSITPPSYEVNTANAGKVVQQPNGQYFKYDNNGRVEEVYANEADMKANRCSSYILYNDDDSVSSFNYNLHDVQGNELESICYNADGTFDNKCVYKYDAQGNKLESIRYNADGTFYNKWVHKYDVQGNELETIRYNADGTFYNKWVYKYDADGNGFCTIEYNSEGKADGVF